MSNDWEEAKKEVEEFYEMMDEIEEYLPNYGQFEIGSQEEDHWQIPEQSLK